MRRILQESKKYDDWEAPRKTYLSLLNKTKTVNDDVYDMDGDNSGDAREDVFEEEDGNGAEEGDDEKKRSIEEKIVNFFA